PWYQRNVVPRANTSGGLGGSGGGGFGSALLSGSGLLSPEQELMVLLDTLAMAQAIIESNQIQFDSGLDVLFFLVVLYEMNCGQVVAAILAAAGGTGTGAGTGVGTGGGMPPSPGTAIPTTPTPVTPIPKG